MVGTWWIEAFLSSVDKDVGVYVNPVVDIQIIILQSSMSSHSLGNDDLNWGISV